MTPMTALTISCVFLCGAVIGSLLNAGIRRIPVEEEDVPLPRHPYCTGCGYQRTWYDCIPLLGYALQRGRCPSCGSRLSIQYPIVEAANGILYLLVYLARGLTRDCILLSLMASALLLLSVIDLETYEIPVGINLFLLGLGAVRCFLDWENWREYVIGFFAVSLFLFLIQLVSGGTAIGGGDVKLMASAGLLLGWRLVILAFVLGCILGSVLHLLRMRLDGAKHMLAFGPYLSMGVFIAALWGDDMIAMYLRLLLIN